MNNILLSLLRPRLFIFIFAASVLASGVSDAQSISDSLPGSQSDPVNRIQGRAPSVGDLLPDLIVWNAAGDPFRLASLRGGYTVLVFGCLT